MGLLVHWDVLFTYYTASLAPDLGVGHGGDGHLHQLIGLSAPRAERAPARHHGLARDV